MLRLLSFIVFVTTISLPLLGQSKPIKCKFRGVYEGQIPSYEVRLGQELVVVKAAEMRVYLNQLCMQRLQSKDELRRYNIIIQH